MAHLLRLDATDRQSRFGRGVSDEYLTHYARQLTAAESAVIGYAAGNRLCAMAELRAVPGSDGAVGEVALSVDRKYRGEGIGSELFEMTLLLARARGFSSLQVHCSTDNAPMCAIAEAHATVRTRSGSELTYVLETSNSFNAPVEAGTAQMESQPCLP